MAFRISLQSSKSYKIASKLIGQNIFDLINEDLIDYYSTPGDIFNLYLFSKEHEIDLKNINLKSFIDIIIKKQYYKKETSIKYLTYNFVELFLRNNLSKNTWGRSRLEVSNKFQFRRSFHYKSSLPSGHKVSLKDLRFVRPCDGIGYDQINDILEKKLTKSVNSFDPCLLEDFEK